MKKWIAMLLAVLTAVSLTACAAKSGGQEMQEQNKSL